MGSDISNSHTLRFSPTQDFPARSAGGPWPPVTKLDGVRRMRSHIHKFLLSHFRSEDAPHPTPLHLLMPLHPKDLTRAEATLRAVVERLAHPIDGVTIVAPAPSRMTHLHAALPPEIPLAVIDEEQFLPPAVLNRDLVDSAGKSRKGWLRQQFIKMNWPQHLDCEHVFCIDADTKPASRIRFLDSDNRQVLYTADEYSDDYWRTARALLGDIQRGPWSFVAHCMLFERDILSALQNHIQLRSGLSWDEAILRAIDLDVSQCFSEFELYGNFAIHAFPDKVRQRYFLNHKVSPEEFLKADIAPGNKRFRFLSSHIKSAA